MYNKDISPTAFAFLSVIREGNLLLALAFLAVIPAGNLLLSGA